MNYRHIFHAGNRCDIVKHALLTLILRHLRAKEGAFAVLDSHAGVGLYDIADPRAAKTAEAEQGILRLLAAPRIGGLADYDAILQKMNPLWNGKDSGHFRTYPGSPLIAYHMLRPQDRLIACELHAEEAAALRSLAPQDARLQIHHRDGYGALKAFLPPVEKRGVVLIDPPFEAPDEFEKLAQALREAQRRWPTGIYMAWYPIKDRPAIWKFHDALVASGISKILCTEFIYEEESRTDRLHGSGMIIINPPWRLDDEINALFPQLHQALQSECQGTVVKWL